MRRQIMNDYLEDFYLGRGSALKTRAVAQGQRHEWACGLHERLLLCRL